MDSVSKIFDIISQGKDCKKEIEQVIIKEIETDRILIIEAIEKSHCYGFDDISESLEIKLRKQWQTNDIRT